MKLTLEIPLELESSLTAEADRQGLPLAEYALRVLRMSQPNHCTLDSGAELVDFWQQQGIVGTRHDITDSQSHARNLRHDVEKRSGE